LKENGPGGRFEFIENLEGVVEITSHGDDDSDSGDDDSDSARVIAKFLDVAELEIEGTALACELEVMFSNCGDVDGLPPIVCSTSELADPDPDANRAQLALVAIYNEDNRNTCMIYALGIAPRIADPLSALIGQIAWEVGDGSVANIDVDTTPATTPLAIALRTLHLRNVMHTDFQDTTFPTRRETILRASTVLTEVEPGVMRVIPTKKQTIVLEFNDKATTDDVENLMRNLKYECKDTFDCGTEKRIEFYITGRKGASGKADPLPPIGLAPSAFKDIIVP